jgi:polysaccharide pyruvyl transferase WcaK-like protein
VKKNLKIAYSGAIGNYGNIGDDACYEAIKEMLPKNSEVLKGFYYDKNISKGNPDLFIIGGGTILSIVDHEKTIGAFSNVSLIDVHSLLNKKIPIIIWGSGIIPDILTVEKHLGYMTNVHPNALEILNRAKFLGVRGPISKLKLEKIGCSHSQVIGDPAFLLGTHDQPNRDRRIIALNIGYSNGASYFGQDNFNQLLDIIKPVIERLKRRGYRVVFFSMWPGDKLYSNNMPILIRPYDSSIENLINFFKQCHCVIGTRLHSSILAAASGTPFISIGYRDKCYDFASSIELGSFVCKCTSKYLVDRILSKIDFLEDSFKYESVVDQILNYKLYYKQKHLKVQRLVNNLLEEM